MKFIRLVGAGALALILGLGAGCLTPLRADCAPWQVAFPTGNYSCYVTPGGYTRCDPIIECVDIPGWVLYYPLALRPMPLPKFQAQPISVRPSTGGPDARK